MEDEIRSLFQCPGGVGTDEQYPYEEVRTRRPEGVEVRLIKGYFKIVDKRLRVRSLGLKFQNGRVSVDDHCETDGFLKR